jgi:hypothetical protein
VELVPFDQPGIASLRLAPSLAMTGYRSFWVRVAVRRANVSQREEVNRIEKLVIYEDAYHLDPL